MINKYKLLSNFSVEDTVTGKRFNPLKEINRKQAEIMAEEGDYELLEIINQLELEGNSYKSRMAADVDIDGLLKSLEGDVALDKAIADAEVYIDNRAYDLKKLGLYTNKSKSLAEAEAQLNDVGELKGNVPMPLMVEQQGNRKEHRLHTNYEQNPVTGERQIVAYMDPTNRKKALRTYFGEMNDNLQGKYDYASEYVGNQALKLAGIPSIVNNSDYKNRADLRDLSVAMGEGNIDVEKGLSYLDKYTLPLQLTALMRVSKEIGTDKAAALRAMDMYMKDNPDAANLLEAIDKIRNTSLVQNTPNKYYLGKGFKAFNAVPEDRINKILNLEYSNSIPDDNNQRRVGVARPPKDINLLDIKAGMQILNDIGRNIGTKSNPKGVSIHSLRYENSAGGEPDPRYKVKANIPKKMVSSKGDKFSVNMLENNPLTQQLLDMSVLKQRMV